MMKTAPQSDLSPNWTGIVIAFVVIAVSIVALALLPSGCSSDPKDLKFATAEPPPDPPNTGAWIEVNAAMLWRGKAVGVIKAGCTISLLPFEPIPSCGAVGEIDPDTAEEVAKEAAE